MTDLYNEILTEHNMHPCHKHELANADFHRHGINPTCGDEITLSLKLDDDIIEEAAFSGIGCAISQASTDIMIDLMLGSTIDDAKTLCRLFIGMIQGTFTDENELAPLDEALTFKNIAKMPARVKCATLSWHTMEALLNSAAAQAKSQ